MPLNAQNFILAIWELLQLKIGGNMNLENQLIPAI